MRRDDRKFVGAGLSELRESATTTRTNSLATRFEMFLQLVRDQGSVDDPLAGAFAQGLHSALQEADARLAPPLPSAWKVSWLFQVPGSDEWHEYALVLPEDEARYLVSDKYVVPIRKNILLEAKIGEQWVVVQEGQTP